MVREIQAIIELDENESMEFASMIQAKLDMTKNRLYTLDVLLEALRETGIHVVVPSMAPKNKVMLKLKDKKDKLAIVINSGHVAHVNEVMDRGLPLTRSIPDVVKLMVEAINVIGVYLIIPGVTDVDEYAD